RASPIRSRTRPSPPARTAYRGGATANIPQPALCPIESATRGLLSGDPSADDGTRPRRLSPRELPPEFGKRRSKTRRTRVHLHHHGHWQEAGVGQAVDRLGQVDSAGVELEL